MISTTLNDTGLYRVSNKSGNSLINNNDGGNKLIFCVTTDLIGVRPSRVEKNGIFQKPIMS